MRVRWEELNRILTPTITSSDDLLCFVFSIGDISPSPSLPELLLFLFLCFLVLQSSSTSYKSYYAHHYSDFANFFFLSLCFPFFLSFSTFSSSSSSSPSSSFLCLCFPRDQGSIHSSGVSCDLFLCVSSSLQKVETVWCVCDPCH